MRPSNDSTNRLRALVDDETPTVALSFSDDLSDAELNELSASAMDVAELRIDRYSSVDLAHVVTEVERFTGVPTLATIRIEAEGGQWRGSDSARAQLFSAVLPLVDGVDIELASAPAMSAVIDEARALGTVIVISYHDFETTPSPDELTRIASDAKACGADLVKISVMAQSTEDVRSLAAFTLANRELGLIVIAMGPLGTASRVFFPVLGSRLTYAAYGPRWVVPGQLSFEETVAELRRFSPSFATTHEPEVGHDLVVRPIGRVVGGRVAPDDDGWASETCEIHLDPTQFDESALTGLDEFSHVEIVFHFHRVDPDDVVATARRPRGREDWPLVGIFAQRGRVRPNRLGVSIARVVSVDGLRLSVAGLDAIDGTPVIDVKPVMTGFLPRGAVVEPAWSTELMAGYWTTP